MARKKAEKQSINVYLPIEIYKEIKAFSAVSSQSISTILEEVVLDWWKKHPAHQKAAQLAKLANPPQENSE